MPRTTAAPVGSEVILVAGVVGPDNYLRTNRRLEWSISQGSVGQFVDIGRADSCNWLVGDFTKPQLVDATRAIGTTSRVNLRLHRGTPTPADDVQVLAGQGWISVTSPIEGATQVVVYAPDVYPGNARVQTATIHWVNAQWRFPTPTIGAAGGRQTLTTAVTRTNDQSPCAGWLVRYQILDGPAAGFAPNGASSIEVPTDSSGQATAEVRQPQPAPGVNRVSIQVIRPGTLPGADGRQFVLGSGTATVTWTAPSISLRKVGPAVGSLGALLTFRNTVTNTGDQPAQDVVVVEDVPDGASFVSSNPPATQLGQQLQWRLGTLGPGESRAIDINYRAERTGSLNAGAIVTAAGGLRASDTANVNVGSAEPQAPSPAVGTTSPNAGTNPSTPAPTTAGQPSIDIQATGPTQVNVGGRATCLLRITNRGPGPATKLTIKDVLDAGLHHERGPSIEATLPDVPALRQTQISVTVTAVQPGRQCQRIEVSGPAGLLATKDYCVEVIGRAGAAPPSSLPGAATAGSPSPTNPNLAQPGAPPTNLPVAGAASAPPQVELSVSPPQQTVGQTATLSIRVINPNPQPLTGVQVIVQWDAAVKPVMASEGYRAEGRALYWNAGNLAPGADTRFDVQYQCLASSVRSLQHVRVTTAEGLRAESEAVLSIRPSAFSSPEANAPAPPPAIAAITTPAPAESPGGGTLPGGNAFTGSNTFGGWSAPRGAANNDVAASPSAALAPPSGAATAAPPGAAPGSGVSAPAGSTAANGSPTPPPSPLWSAPPAALAGSPSAGSPAFNGVFGSGNEPSALAAAGRTTPSVADSSASQPPAASSVGDTPFGAARSGGFPSVNLKTPALPVVTAEPAAPQSAGLQSAGLPAAAAAATAGAATTPEAEAATNLDLQVIDLHDPISAGRVEAYEIRVKNNGKAIARLVSVEMRFPAGMTPSLLGTVGPPSTQVRQEHQSLMFTPVPEIRAGETAIYRVRAQTRQPGKMTVEVTASSMGQNQAVRAEASTDVEP